MQSEITNTVKTLKASETILYPTDTVWGLGCDATNFEAVSKIYQLKKRAESKSLVLLVNGLEMLETYVNITDEIKNILSNSKNPTTIIYSNPKKLAKNVVASNNTVAIRIVNDLFCNKLITQFGKPIVSTSANISGTPTPKLFKEIEPTILDSVGYVVNLHQEKESKKPSTILKIEEDGSVTIIRK